MDREVAIELLKQEKGVLVQVINTGYMIGIGKEYTDKGRATIEALDLAIKALGQTVSEDCISRDGLLFSLEPMMEDWEGMKTVKLIIETIPSVPPTERTLESEQMREYIPKDEVLDIIKSMPMDMVEEYVYELDGIWLVDDEEKFQLSPETSTNEGVAQSATTTDCISRAGLLFALEPMMEDWQGMKTVKLIIETIPPVTQPISEDCISRKQAIEAIEGVDWYHVNSQGELVSGSTSDEESWYKAEDIYKAFESLPPVTPTERTREWIPVSEKNPSQTGEYLVTAVCDNGSTFTDKFGYTPTTDGGWYDPEVPSQTHTDWNEHIIAWQPMPTPYKGGDTE